jgi:hypothetical protein
MGIKQAIHRLKAAVAGRTPADAGVEGFPLDPASPQFAWQCCIDEFLREVPDFTDERGIKPAGFPSGRRMLDATPEEQIAIVEALIWRRVWLHKAQRHSFSTSFGLLRKIKGLLLRRELPYTPAHAANLVAIVGAQLASTHWFDDDVAPILKICERLRAQGAMTPILTSALQELKGRMRPGSFWESAARKRYREAIERLVAVQRPNMLDAGEAWSNVAREDLDKMPGKERESWLSLLAHCRSATASRPTQKWNRAAQVLIEAVGRDVFQRHITRWFELVALPRPVHCAPRSRWQPDPDWLITDSNSLVLKGLAWCCTGMSEADVCRALSNLAEVCFKKVPNLGPRCPRQHVVRACRRATQPA